MLEESFIGVSRMFLGIRKGVSRKIEWCSLRPSRISKGVSREYQGSFKDVLRKGASRMFQ